MKNRHKLQVHNIHLYEGDYEMLGRIHLHRRPAEIVRDLVRNYIERVEVAVEAAKEKGYGLSNDR